jgi:CRP-like cAMP-binding protein
MLPPQELDELASRGRTQRFARGERLLQEGEPGDRVIVLLSGRAKVSCAGPDGQDVVLDFRGPGDLIGDLSAIDGGRRSSSVEALERVEALVVPASDLVALLERRPALGLAVLRMLTRRFRDADRRRIEFAASDSVGRTAARLVELAERYGEQGDAGVVISLPVSQEELAGWAATSRASLVSALRTLRELGWIETERRRITVRDLDALRARARSQNWLEPARERD